MPPDDGNLGFPFSFAALGETDYVFAMEPTFIQNIVAFDHWLFACINGEWTSSVLDTVMPFITDLNHNPYVPFVIIALFVAWGAKQRYRALMWIATLVVAVACSDLFAYRVIKTLADRNRPEQAGVQVVLRTEHHSGSSFPSNHAANAFAGASVMSGAFPALSPLWFFVAFLIAYSRVYVGVHFPLDVIAGGVLGWLIGFLAKIFLGPWITKAELSEENRFERADLREEKERRKGLLRKK